MCFWELEGVPRVTRPGFHGGQIGCVGGNFAAWEGDMPFSENAPYWPLWSQGFEAGFEMCELANQYGLNEWEIIAGMVPWLVMGNRMGVISERLFGGPINPSSPE
jgi:hypothetical protein